MALLSTILSAVLRKGVLVGLVLLLLLGLVEGILWIFAPVSPYLRYQFQFHNRMEPFGLANTSSFEVDSRELRKRKPAEDREKQVKLLILGGEGNYLPLQDASDTWWGRLATTLENRHPELALQVDVKAVSATRPGVGTSMRHVLAWAKTYAKEVDPDLLAVSFGVSEVLDPAPDYQYNPTRMQTLPGLPRPGSIKDRAVSVSQIARRLRHWRSARSEANLERRRQLEQPNYFLNNMGMQRSVYESFPFDVNPPRREESRDPKLEYLDGLRSFQALADRLGAELVILAEPSLHDDLLGFQERIRLKRLRWLRRPSAAEPNGSGLRPDPGWVEAQLNRYYRAGADWAAKEDIPFVNLNREDVLAKNTENFVDDVTLTQRGSHRVAEEVSPIFEAAIKKILAK